MGMSKDQAKKVADALCACPFCGNRLEASIRGSGERAVNPKAKCVTEDCMGSKLPVICLDVPSQVDAWNRRAQPEIHWSSARDVARLDDMSPDGHLRVLLDGDNDVLVEVFDGEHFASIEFCTPGAGGGQSSETRLALIGVMRSIEADNNARPGRAHPRFK